jgi:hypothetical protein
MSERVSVSATVRIAALLVAALIVFGALLARGWLAPDVWDRDLNATVPILPDLNNEPPLSQAEATRIAIEEIKKREGWTGKFTHSEREGFRWYITIRHEPNVPHDYRIVEVHGTDGKVLSLGVLKTDAP